MRAQKKAANQPVSSSPSKALSLADAYEVLGLNRWASHVQIKQGYRRMMGKYHPDKMISRGASEVEVIEAHDIVNEIKNAYDILFNLKRMR